MTNCWRYYTTATIQELTWYGVNIYMIDSVDNVGIWDQGIIFKPHCHGNPTKRLYEREIIGKCVCLTEIALECLLFLFGLKRSILLQLYKRTASAHRSCFTLAWTLEGDLLEESREMSVLWHFVKYLGYKPEHDYLKVSIFKL